MSQQRCGSPSVFVYMRLVSVCVCVALRQRGSSVQCLCVRLAFQLKTHTDAKEVSLESLDAPQQEVHESRDATYVLVPTTLDV